MYAVIGGYCDAGAGAIAISGPCTGNVRLGIPVTVGIPYDERCLISLTLQRKRIYRLFLSSTAPIKEEHLYMLLIQRTQCEWRIYYWQS